MSDPAYLNIASHLETMAARQPHTLAVVTGKGASALRISPIASSTSLEFFALTFALFKAVAVPVLAEIVPLIQKKLLTKST